ncbi:hypothetical protein ACSTLF_00035, partial [Vibrio parahaemolyticus]
TKRLVVMAGLALLPGVAAAQFSVAPPSKDAGRQVAGLYHVEPQHTEVLFSVLHEGFTAYFGIFSNASGTLNFVPDDPA